MNQEIERKFAVKYIPKNLKIEKKIEITQDYIYYDKFTIVRVRKIKNEKNEIEYIYTIKTKGQIENSKNDIANKYEIETKIKKEEYEKILKTKNKKINTIEKTRLVVNLEENLRAEIDIYYNNLENLLTLEVEFPNEEKAKNFKKPDWFGEELGYKKLSNGKLSKMTKKDFQKVVTKEFLENNKKIINELKEKI